MYKFLLLIAFFSLMGCSNNDDDLISEPESDFYTVTLSLQGIQGAGYNTKLRINTFHEANANLISVYENNGDIQWENGVIEHTFTIDAIDVAGKPLTRLVCFVDTTLYQEYSYAIDYFTFTATLKNSSGDVVSELSTNEDITDGWLSFNSELEFEF